MYTHQCHDIHSTFVDRRVCRVEEGAELAQHDPVGLFGVDDNWVIKRELVGLPPRVVLLVKAEVAGHVVQVRGQVSRVGEVAGVDEGGGGQGAGVVVG